VSDSLQYIFDKGHAAEASIRPTVEEIIDDELFPVTGTRKISKLSLLASFDGVTLSESKIFEHKLYSEKLAESVRNEDIDIHYKIQMEQQMMVSGAKTAIFVTSDGTPEKMEFMYCDSDPKLRKRIIAGWKQFQVDLAEYVPQQAEIQPVADVIKDLPVLSVNIKG